MNASPAEQYETAVVFLDPQGTILASGGASSLLGPTVPAVPGRWRVSEVFHSDEGKDLLAAVEEVAEERWGEGGRSFLVRLASKDSGGRALLTLFKVGAELVAGVLSGTDGNGDEPSRERGHLSASEEERELVEQAWAGLRDAMVLLTSSPGPRGPRILTANAAFCALVGLVPVEIRGKPLRSLLMPGDELDSLVKVHRTAVEQGRSASDLAILRAGSGRPRMVDWEMAPVHDREGRITSVIAVVREVTLTSMGAPARGSATTDSPTGLPNQMHFRNRVQRSVERATLAHPYAFALIGLRMKGLGAIEQRFGSVMCNAVLDALVRRLRHRLRSSDLIARISRDRLAVLLDYFAPRGAVEDVLERIRHTAGDSFTVGGRRLELRVAGTASTVWSLNHPPPNARELLDGLQAALADTAAGGSPPEWPHAKPNGGGSTRAPSTGTPPPE